MSHGTTITAYEAARRSGVFPTYIYGLLVAGRLRGTKVDGKWLIRTEDFEAWRAGHKTYRSRRREAIQDATA